MKETTQRNNAHTQQHAPLSIDLCDPHAHAVPDHSSPVNERPGLLLPVDNSKGEVIKTDPLLSQNYSRMPS
jgi:hypothetical protein